MLLLVVGGRGRAENPLLWLVRAGIKNDFEQVVFPEFPELREQKSALLRAGAKYASLSGSGSTLYGLFASKQAALRAAATLQTARFHCPGNIDTDSAELLAAGGDGLNGSSLGIGWGALGFAFIWTTDAAVARGWAAGIFDC